MANKIPSLHEGGTVHVHADGTLGGVGPPTLEQFNVSQELQGQGNLPGGLNPLIFFPSPTEPGVFFNKHTGQRVDLNASQQPAGGGDPFAGPRFGLQQEQFALQQKQFEFQQMVNARDFFAQQGNLALARQAAERAEQLQREIFELQQEQFEFQREQEERQAADAQERLRLQERGQDIGVEIANLDRQQRELASLRQDALGRGELALVRSTEERMRAVAESRARLEAAGLSLQAQTAGANILGQLAPALGNIEQRQREQLAQLAANPRDFPQLNIALGGGTSFLQNALGGQPIMGQSPAAIGTTPTLGAGFERLVEQVTARPELALFERAIAAAERLGQQDFSQFGNIGRLAPLPQLPVAPTAPTQTQAAPTAQQIAAFQERFRQGGITEAFRPGRELLGFKKGGKVVSDEPIVGIGIRSGLPKFTLGEPTAQFPQGAPEKLEVTPLAHGGIVSTQPVKKTTKPVSGTPFGPGFSLSERDVTLNPTGNPVLTAGPTESNLTIPIPEGFELPRGLEALRGSGTGEFVFRPGQRSGGFRFSRLAGLREEFGPGGVQRSPQLGAPATPQLGGGGTPPGEILRNLMNSLGPRAFSNLLPSQFQFLSGIISQLGLPPEDFFAALQRQFPTGGNPALTAFGNFSKGGTIAVVPAA